MPPIYPKIDLRSTQELQDSGIEEEIKHEEVEENEYLY